MIHFSLFSGIGGFDLAAEWMGWQNYLSCDINEFGNKVRAHYWPNAYHHTDIHTLTYETINEQLTSRFGANWRSDDIILTGGFPCQPYSAAGKRLGKEDSRHLWPEMLRVIREVAPSWVVGENVRGLTNWNGGLVFDEVCADLETLGYKVSPFIIPASAVNAPHQRERIWVVAFNTKNTRNTEVRGICERSDNESIGICQKNENATNTNSDGFKQCDCQHEVNTSEGWQYAQRDIDKSNGDGDAINSNRKRFKQSISTKFIRQISNKKKSNEINILSDRKWGAKLRWENFPTQSPICGGDDGLPTKLDGISFPKWRSESIAAYGNAVVPQVVHQIFKAIQKSIETQQ